IEAVRAKLEQELALGYCNAGTVLEVGAGVEGFSAGDRVVSNGPHAEVSSAGESHPHALAEPYVNVSAHTAPAVEPRRTPICQWANNPGSRREIRAIQCAARRL